MRTCIIRRGIFRYAKYIIVYSVIACIIGTIYLWPIIHSRNDSDIVCAVSSHTRIKLFELISATEINLKVLKINHFLCYDSLYGAIEDHEPFPWQFAAHFCLLREDFVKLDETSFHRQFQLGYLSLQYNSADGKYSVTKANHSGRSDPVVFMHVFEVDEKHDTILRHSGWKRKLPTTNCEGNSRLHCFPRQLASPPLQLKSFGPLMLPIPKEPKKMLKYLFPDTWWKPFKPIC